METEIRVAQSQKSLESLVAGRRNEGFIPQNLWCLSASLNELSSSYFLQTFSFIL